MTHPADRCVHELFEEQAEKTPEAVAVELEGQALMYAELNRRANQLAHHLRPLGVGPEVPVGLCVERSLDMVVGLLGILKAGGAYVPLDPTYPKDRLAFMMQDARIPLLLTQGHLVGALPTHATPTLCLDEWASIARESMEKPTSGVEPGNLTYVIYTSGSTGKPKGVAVEHRSLCNLIVAYGRHLGIQRGSRVLQFHRLGFDVATCEIFLTLTAGGTLCLYRSESLLPGQTRRSTSQIYLLLRWPSCPRMRRRSCARSSPAERPVQPASRIAGRRGAECSIRMARPRRRCVPQ
jgi:non-ribosomal peptide synthetase component F